MDKGKLTAILVLIVVASGLITYQLTRGSPPLKIFHAGSLAKPFEEIEQQFENGYDFDVQRTSLGSVEVVKQVTELHKTPDIVAVADYSLIPQMMIPEYADWYIQFAQNGMVLAYTDQSKYANEIDENNWYEILGRSDVRFGFSNPNADPCGYRSPMVIQLAEMHYGNSTIFDGLIGGNTNITVNYENNVYSIEVPETEDLGPNTEKVEITEKSVNLLAKLTEGSIDYAFEYRSVAFQHGFNFVELPAGIDLSSTEYENTYKRVKIFSGEKWHTGKPIVYGVTIPKNAPHREGAIEFVKLLISEDGQQALQNCGQPPIIPAIASDIDKLPGELRSFVAA
jgi:molybdate/tungstate transport system substrate-binding protein